MTEVKGLQSGTAPIEGARLYYEIAGAVPPLVLVHAGFVDRRMWDEQFPGFVQPDTFGGDFIFTDRYVKATQQMDTQLFRLVQTTTPVATTVSCITGITRLLDFTPA